MDEQKLITEDIENKLRELWASIPNDRLKTVTIYPDGYFEPGVPDTDDTPLAVGDIVAWSVLRSSLFRDMEMPERVPFMAGVVQNIEPWDDSLAGMVYVAFNNGSGVWKERDQLRLIEKAGIA